MAEKRFYPSQERTEGARRFEKRKDRKEREKEGTKRLRDFKERTIRLISGLLSRFELDFSRFRDGNRKKKKKK